MNLPGVRNRVSEQPRTSGGFEQCDRCAGIAAVAITTGATSIPRGLAGIARPQMAAEGPHGMSKPIRGRPVVGPGG